MASHNEESAPQVDQQTGQLAAGLLLASLLNTIGNQGNQIAELEDKSAADQIMIELLDEAAMLDSKTGLFNHNGLQRLYPKYFDQARRSGKSALILMMDVDGFKQVNEELGHPEGDRRLRVFGKQLPKSLRPLDILGRWGGDEFMAFIPEATTEEGMEIAQRMISDVENLTESTPVKNSLSIGLAIMDDPNLEAMTEHVNSAMRQAKQLGKAQAVIAEPTSRF